ncbi:MAG: hypothetical protein CMC82_01610 [Flavobacteriaceae bacterium]|nr:hypothetical protein [Flavobacteriaceae bacterium]|tara:strand:+ start:191 stop:2035 length:1845 start_codon:yes stop_codon:yes gene_type:complete
MTTHRVTVNFANCDHWHWSLNGGTDSRVMTGNTAEITAVEGTNTLVAKGVDASHLELATDTHTFDYAAPVVPWQSVLTACDPNIDTNEYLYDDNHYVIRYVALYWKTSSREAQIVVHEFYCYGSASSFITSFGDTAQGGSGIAAGLNSGYLNGQPIPVFIPTIPHDPYSATGGSQSSAVSLFNQSIATGYAKWSYSFYPGALGDVITSINRCLDSATTATLNHELDTTGWGPYAGMDIGGSNFNYRGYVHPEACSSMDNRMDPWYKNAVISKGADITAAEISAGTGFGTPEVTNNGATANHLSLMNSLNLGTSPPSPSWDYKAEEVNIYPIKRRPLSGWQVSVTACDSTANIDDFIYDDNHYLIRYAFCGVGTQHASTAGFFEMYCYGSAPTANFVTSFGPEETYNVVNRGGSGNYKVKWQTPSSRVNSLFNESIAVGFRKREYMSIVMYAGVGYGFNAIRQEIHQNYAPVDDINFPRYPSTGYRTYVEPQFCDPSPHPVGWQQNTNFNSGGAYNKFQGESIDPYRDNAAIYIGTVDNKGANNTGFNDDIVLVDNGATSSHKAAFDMIYSDMFPLNQYFTPLFFLEESHVFNLAIYPIKPPPNPTIAQPGWYTI